MFCFQNFDSIFNPPFFFLNSLIRIAMNVRGGGAIRSRFENGTGLPDQQYVGEARLHGADVLIVGW